jgi:soluble lytic murein transglycosylase-like protein
VNTNFDGIIREASARWGVPFTWIKAVIGTESNFQVMAHREEPQINDASYGLMQLLSATAAGLGFTGDPEDLYIPEVNIDLGTKLLSQLRGRWGDDFRRVYSAYNSGSPDRWETSPQVLHNVTRAEDWLSRVIAENPAEVAAVAGGVGIIVAGLLALWFWGRR